MGRWTQDDIAYMNVALDMAARPGWRTHPNPMVGAVLVRDGRIIGRGYHKRAGGPHAEIMALQEAGTKVGGASLYVTLEPCCHHGRTPPCTDALIQAGISRVVAAMRDPNPKVGGLGFQSLRRNGIRAESGLLGAQARRLNEAFCTRVRKGRPWVILKSAISLDGKIAAESGDSRWISSKESRAHAHDLRDRVDAILTGIGTVLGDDPQLTARPRGRNGRDPLRVIVDSRLRIPLNAKALHRSSSASIIVAATKVAPERRIRTLRNQGAEVWVLPTRNARVSLRSLLARLAKQEVTTLLVEGGGEVAGAFLRQGLVDRVAFYIAPLLIGGDNAPGPLRGEGATTLSGAWDLRETDVRRMGPDLLVEGYIKPRKKATSVSRQ